MDAQQYQIEWKNAENKVEDLSLQYVVATTQEERDKIDQELEGLMKLQEELSRWNRTHSIPATSTENNRGEIL